MLALAFLMARAAAAAPPTPADPWHHAGRIALTAAEIRRLLNALLITPLGAQPPAPLLTTSGIPHWSNWRRHHQGHTRHRHYQRRHATELDP